MAGYYNVRKDLGNPMARAGIAPPLYQRSPYATATVMAHPVLQAGAQGYYPPTGGAYPQYPYGAPYGPAVGFGVGMAPTWSVTPLTGYPSAYPHVLNGAVMAGEPFRMTPFFGPAYMPGYMDMLFTQMMRPRRSGGGGGAPRSGGSPAPAREPRAGMNLRWAPCTTKGCMGRSLLFDSGIDTGLPLVDMPEDVAAEAQAASKPSAAPTAQAGFPAYNEAWNALYPQVRPAGTGSMPEWARSAWRTGIQGTTGGRAWGLMRILEGLLSGSEEGSSDVVPPVVLSPDTPEWPLSDPLR